MIHKFVLYVAVITLISDSANGELKNVAKSLMLAFKSFHFLSSFIGCCCNRGQPVQCEKYFHLDFLEYLYMDLT